MNQRAAGAIHLRIVALAFAAWIFDFYDLVLYSFLLVPVARELHLTAEQSSLALGMSLLMTAIGGVIFGFLGDRFGRKPMIAATVAIYGVGTALCGFSHTLTQLIVFRSITGLGMGGGWAPGQSLVAESVPADRRARYAAYVQTGAPLGVLLAAAAGGYRRARIGMASDVHAVGRARDIRRRRGAEVDAGERRLARARAPTSARRGVDLRAILAHRRIFAMLFVVVLLNSEAYWFTYTWMPGYLELKRGLTAVAASHLLIKMQIGGVLGYLTFGRVADRFGRRPAFCAYGLLMAAGTIPPTILWNAAVAVPRTNLGRDVHGGIRHRHLGGNRADDRRDAADANSQHVARIDAQRHARIPVLHPDSDCDARRARRFRRNAVARRSRSRRWARCWYGYFPKPAAARSPRWIDLSFASPRGQRRRSSASGGWRTLFLKFADQNAALQTIARQNVSSP